MCDRKTLLVYVALACMNVAMPVFASAAAPSKTGQAGQKDEGVDLRTLVLIPMSEPAQALKVRLLPTVIDQKNGNAALLLHTAAELCPSQEGEGQDEQ